MCLDEWMNEWMKFIHLGTRATAGQVCKLCLFWKPTSEREYMEKYTVLKVLQGRTGVLLLHPFSAVRLKGSLVPFACKD